MALLFEGVEELVGFEERVEGDDGVEDLGTLGGVLEILGFERSAEDRAERIDQLA